MSENYTCLSQKQPFWDTSCFTPKQREETPKKKLKVERSAASFEQNLHSTARRHLRLQTPWCVSGLGAQMNFTCPVKTSFRHAPIDAPKLRLACCVLPCEMRRVKPDHPDTIQSQPPKPTYTSSEIISDEVGQTLQIRESLRVSFESILYEEKSQQASKEGTKEA